MADIDSATLTTRVRREANRCRCAAGLAAGERGAYLFNGVLQVPVATPARWRAELAEGLESNLHLRLGLLVERGVWMIYDWPERYGDHPRFPLRAGSGVPERQGARVVGANKYSRLLVSRIVGRALVHDAKQMTG